MIELYYYTSPNARKVLMMLEEVGLPYEVGGPTSAPATSTRGVRRDQSQPQDSCAGRLRWARSDEPITLFESGAILLYLAEKTGRLLPEDPRRRWNVITVVVLADIESGAAARPGGPLRQPCREPRHRRTQYAVERYRREAERLYGVLESQLAGRDYIDDELSIADIAAFPWVRVAKGQGVNLDDFPNVKRWCDRVAQRPSARKKLDRDDATKQAAKSNYYTDETWKLLFGGKAPQRSATATPDWSCHPTLSSEIQP